MSNNDGSRYAGRGVSSNKGDVHKAIAKIDKGLFPRAFCKVTPDHFTGSEQHCLVMHADGAGTKSSLAYAYWQETGQLDVWRGVAQDAVVMNTDDLLCIGAVDNILLSSTIGRNKRLIPAEVISEIINGTEAFLDTMRDHGVGIYSTGGETADVGDLVRTIIIDSTVTARLERSKIITGEGLGEELLIVGLSSYGQATYETQYNGGMGSNGLTSARHDMFSDDVARKYPETYDPAIPADLTYTGRYKLTDLVDGVPVDMGRLVLSPTRTYAPIIVRALKECRTGIRGMIHCTGGAQTKILHFAPVGIHIIKDNLLPIPPLFRLIEEQSGTSRREMYQVFNMGHRMELYVKPEAAQEIIDISRSFGVDAQVIGRTERFSEIAPARLTIKDSEGTYEYPI